MSIRKKAPAPRPAEPSPAGSLAGDEGLSRRLTFLLNRVALVLVDETASQFRSLGLSIPATRALISLYECGVQTIGELARMTCVELSTMSHIVRRLEAQGLVSRERHTTDNRVVHAALTEAGRVIGRQCCDASITHERVLLGDMPARDQSVLKDLLVRVYENAQKGFSE